MLRSLCLTLSLALSVAAARDAHALPQDSEPTPAAEAPSAGADAEEEAQDAPSEPRMTTEADWGQWERLGAGVLSPDGRWIAYTIRRNDGTSELRLRVIATDSTEVFEQGGRPTFSSDGKWLAFSIGKSEAEREELSRGKKPVENDLGLFDLVGGEEDTIEGVSTFAFSEGGAFLAMQRHGEPGDEHGADLVVRDLASGVDTHFGRVGAFSWSEKGAWLAMTIDAPDRAGNGLRVVDARTGKMRTLDSGEADYVGMTWRDDAADLAVMRKQAHGDDEDATYTVLAWRGLNRKEPRASRYDHLEDETFPGDLRVVDFDGLTWADDGDAVFFGLKAWETRPSALDEADEEQEPAEPEVDEGTGPRTEEAPGEGGEGGEDAPTSMRESLDEAPGVEIWHAKDIQIVPRQKRTQSDDERDSFLAALWLDSGKLVQLEDEAVRDVILLEGQRMALGTDEAPYLEEQRFSATLVDLYAVDVMTGERERVLERVKYTMEGDPRGSRFLFVRDGDIWAYDMQARAATNLTGEVEAAFTDQEDSSLTDEKPPYGVAGWTKKGDQVLLYDRYDIWSFALDGRSHERLTRGAEDSIRHRRVIVAADPDAEQRDVVPPTGFYVSLYGDLTKDSGYGFLKPGRDLDRRVWEPARISGLVRAEDADVFAFTAERFDDSPDLFVGGPALQDAKQVSATNAFASDYLWGHSELVDFENANGVPLQGALYYPADYDESKTYPMVVYIYELRSQSLHQYTAPSERNPYSTSVFTQNGYFVFQPDIVYRAQNPGISAVECVVPAVRKVLESGKVDPERVGLVGHSWGAYQTAFIVTQTDLFAAGVAGAPLTNMMSMSMSIYWNSGQTDAYIFHESQGRMDRPFWSDVDTYIANSPIFSIEDLNTPLLVAFGDDDGAVDWQQGVEMYNAARLAQRPFVMLVYPGENHGLRKKPNQVDYHHRVREWFDTYLTGKEAPEWISDGVPWLDQKKALEEIEKPKGGDKG